MKKFYVKKNGKEVFIGDRVKVTYNKETPLGKSKVSIDVEVDEDTLPILIKHGIIVEKKVEEEKKVERDIDFYAEKLAKKYNVSSEIANKVLTKVIEKDPVTVLSLLLKEVSKDMGKLIDWSRVSQAYYISSVNGEIYSMPLSKAPVHIAKFASYDDAKTAIHILKELFALIYGQSKD